MARVWRLRPRGEFEQVRQNGQAWPHRLFILIVQTRTDEPARPVRVGVAAGKRLGSAVERNRLKRKIRAALQQVYMNIADNTDLIVIARAPMSNASVIEIAAALTEQLQRAQVWRITTEPIRDEAV
jgi:ribonuclease P protein component